MGFIGGKRKTKKPHYIIEKSADRVGALWKMAALCGFLCVYFLLLALFSGPYLGGVEVSK